MADDLREILEQARRDCPEVPDHVWSKVERMIRMHYGASRIYIASLPKKTKLDQLAELDGQLTSEEISKRMGINVRYVQKLQSLRRKK